MCRIIVCLFIVLISCNEGNRPADAQSGARKTPLLILNREGGLGAYTGELLKSEGFNEYDILNADRNTLSLTALQSYDWVIIPQMPFTDSDLNVIVSYVKSGGNIVSFLPSPLLLGKLGAGAVTDTIHQGYIHIDPSTEIGRGLLTVPLKFHGEGMLLNNSPAKVVAHFTEKNSLDQQWPAVIFQDIEMGHAISFLYDLPKNIQYTRQGNPASANREMDGIFGFRSTDLFTGNWVDTAMNCLNHADEQLHLLTHGIEILSHNKKPLPRFWYFPDTLSCLVTLTNDGENSKQKDFIQQFRDVSAKGARMTLYSLQPDKMTRTFTDSLVKAGYEIAAHPDAVRYADRPSWSVMTIAIRDKFAELKTLHGITGITTNANHWFVWCGSDDAGNPDFTAQAKIESNMGIRLDLNYAHYDNNASIPHFLGTVGKRQGNFIGSGLPVRFADTEGKVLDIFQHFNNVYDQQYMELRDSVGFFECFKGLMDRSMDEGIYSYINVKAHNVEYFFSKTPLMQMLDYANARKIPVWTAAELYKFLKVKDEARFSDFTFKRGTLFFTVQSSLSHPNNLSFLLPFNFNGKSISAITGNELSYPLIRKKIKGTDYAWVTIEAGKQHAFRVYYN